MTPVAFRLLKKVASCGELSLKTAIEFTQKSENGHIAQYPLALLIEEGYLGMTLNHQQPSGAEQMREFTLAITLHMFTLPKDSSGSVRYLDVVSSGNIDPANHQIFLRAKGALYLDQHAQKRSDRIWSLALGFVGGVLAAVIT